jgi:hypothetical protein
VSDARVYVDQFPESGWGKWNGGGHMLANDLDALHAMADRIGLRRSWFQDKRHPHYDLTASKRRLALAAGAIEIELGEFPPDSLIRRNGVYERRSGTMSGTGKEPEEEAGPRP